MFDIFKVDPTISDPAVASGITRDANGTLHQKHTAVSNKLADNLAAIATTAWGPVLEGDLIRQKDGSYFLRNKNGSFYGNGRALNAKTGKMQNYDLYGSGRFLNGNPKQSNSSNIVSTGLDSNYLYGYRGKPRTRMNNSKSFKTAWTNARNSGLGTFTWNGKSYNTMKKGETQQDYNSWLSKQNKAPQKASPTQGTPGYSIHVGNGRVTLSTPNGSTTDITNSHNVSTLINNDNYKAPNLGNAATNYLENRPLDSYSELTKHNFDRGDIRQGMRENGGKSDPIKDFKKKKDITKQTYQRNPYTRGKSAKEIAEMQRRNRQEAGAGKGENDANVAPWNYKKKR